MDHRRRQRCVTYLLLIEDPHHLSRIELLVHIEGATGAYTRKTTHRRGDVIEGCDHLQARSRQSFVCNHEPTHCSGNALVAEYGTLREPGSAAGVHLNHVVTNVFS